MPFKVNYSSSKASRQEEHDTAKECRAVLKSKVVIENIFFFKTIFRIFYLWEFHMERALRKDTIEYALSRSAVAILVPESCASLSKNVEIDEI